MAKTAQHLGTVSNVIVIVLVIGFVVQSDGGVGRWWRQYRRDVATQKAISRMWPALEARRESRLGAHDAPIQIIEVADYQCPFCKAVHDAVQKTLQRNPNLAISFVHYPLAAIHPHAEAAARASICAEQQGFFKEMHDHLLETDDWQTSPDWALFAHESGVPDTPRFSSCLDAPSTTARLQADKALVDALGVSATPTFVSQGGIEVGVIDVTTLEAMLQS